LLIPPGVNDSIVNRGEAPMAPDTYTPKPHFIYAGISRFGLLTATSSIRSQPGANAGAPPTLTALGPSSQGVGGPGGHDAAPTAIFQSVMADRDNEEPGVLGNLPRSRPGRRSDKRTTGGARTTKAAGTAKASGSKSSKASSSSTGTRAKRPATAASGRKTGARASTPPRSTGAPASAASTRQEAPSRREPAQRSGDPLAQAVHLAAKVAETGVKTGVGILRRLSGR
jgi:hypothetical protein